MCSREIKVSLDNKIADLLECVHNLISMEIIYKLWSSERNKALVPHFTVITINTRVTLPTARMSNTINITSTAGNTSLDTHKYWVVSCHTL